MLPKISGKIEVSDFLCVGENTERFILFSYEKSFEKVKVDGKTFS